MTNGHLHTHIQHLMVVTLSLGAAGTGVGADPPAPKRPEQTVRTDRYGDPLPQGAVARLGTVRLRAIGAQVGLSPDGKTIVTVTRGMLPLIKIFDAETGKLRERRELPGASLAESLRYYLSSDGRLLAVQESDSAPLDIWDISTNKRRDRLRLGQGQRIDQVVFSPDGKRLAVAHCDKEVKSSVRLWDVAKAEQLWSDKSSSGPLAFTPDGRTLIAAPGEFNDKRDEMPPKEQKLLEMWRRDHTWHAWDAATGKTSRGLRLPEDFGSEFAVAADNRTLVFVPFSDSERHRGVDCRVRLWDLQRGRQIRRLDVVGHIGPFFPDGKSFLTNNGILQRWESATGRPLLPDTEKMGHGTEITGAVYSPDGRRLASSADDRTIRLWDVASAKTLHILRGHEATDLAFTPDGKRLVSGPDNDELYVWNTEIGKKDRRIPLLDFSRNKGHLFSRLQLSSDGRTITVAGYGDSTADKSEGVGLLTRWDLTTGQRTSRIECNHSAGRLDAFSPDGLLLASNDELLDTVTGKRRVKLESEGARCYTFSPDRRLVTGIVLTRELDGDKIARDANCLAIVVWDTKSGRALLHIPIPISGLGPLAISPDGRYLAAAGMNDLRIWELATGKMVLRHKAHERTCAGLCGAFAFCLSFAPGGRTVATGNPDSTILIWSLTPPIGPAAAKDLPRLWEDLAGSDAAKAYSASWRLADAPQESIRFLRERWRPITPAPAEQVRWLLAELNSDEYAKREAATTRLRELGERAVTSLKDALRTNPSLEVRRRVKDLLKLLRESPSGDVLRQRRAVAILERIGTEEAQVRLKTLAQGMREAQVTREAKASLERLAARPIAEKR